MDDYTKNIIKNKVRVISLFDPHNTGRKYNINTDIIVQCHNFILDCEPYTSKDFWDGLMCIWTKEHFKHMFSTHFGQNPYEKLLRIVHEVAAHVDIDKLDNADRHLIEFINNRKKFRGITDDIVDQITLKYKLKK